MTENMKSIRNNWYLWLFPVIAIGITLFLFKVYYENHGRTIQITFDEASVMKVEKTRLRFRGVDIGVVKDIQLSPDHKNVVVSVMLTKDTDDFAVEGSQFWVVTPKVSLQGLSGLDTIFAGPYIEVLPGPTDAKKVSQFKGRPEDVHEASENMSSYVLETASAESINTGDAITFRGMTVGTVGKMSLSKTSQAVNVQINIENRYVQLIRTNTVFWRKVGIQAKLGLFSSKIKVNSFDSIMHGGVEFFTPDNPGPMAKANAKFALATEAPKNYEKWNPKLE